MDNGYHSNHAKSYIFMKLAKINVSVDTWLPEIFTMGTSLSSYKNILVSSYQIMLKKFGCYGNHMFNEDFL